MVLQWYSRQQFCVSETYTVLLDGINVEDDNYRNGMRGKVGRERRHHCGVNTTKGTDQVCDTAEVWVRCYTILTLTLFHAQHKGYFTTCMYVACYWWRGSVPTVGETIQIRPFDGTLWLRHCPPRGAGNQKL